MYSSTIFALAFLAAPAFAAPERNLYRQLRKATSDQCLAAVKAGQSLALPACDSFMLTTVTLEPSTLIVTSTFTSTLPTTTVTVSASADTNLVPLYASACLDASQLASACSYVGVTASSMTLPQRTVTVTSEVIALYTPCITETVTSTALVPSSGAWYTVNWNSTRSQNANHTYSHSTRYSYGANTEPQINSHANSADARNTAPTVSLPSAMVSPAHSPESHPISISGTGYTSAVTLNHTTVYESSPQHTHSTFAPNTNSQSVISLSTYSQSTFSSSTYSQSTSSPETHSQSTVSSNTYSKSTTTGTISTAPETSEAMPTSSSTLDPATSRRTTSASPSPSGSCSNLKFFASNGPYAGQWLVEGEVAADGRAGLLLSPGESTAGIFTLHSNLTIYGDNDQYRWSTTEDESAVNDLVQWHGRQPDPIANIACQIVNGNPIPDGAIGFLECGIQRQIYFQTCSNTGSFVRVQDYVAADHCQAVRLAAFRTC